MSTHMQAIEGVLILLACVLLSAIYMTVPSDDGAHAAAASRRMPETAVVCRVDSPRQPTSR